MRLNTVLVLRYFDVGSGVENHFCTFWGAGDFIGEIGVTLLELARLLLRARPSFQRKFPLPSGSGSASSAHIPVRALSTLASCAVF